MLQVALALCLSTLPPAAVPAGASATQDAPKQGEPASAEPELYPPKRPATHVRFFCLEGKLDLEPMRKALTLLSTPAAPCRLIEGPQATAARPGRSFVALEAPAAVATKDLVAALRKGGGAAEELACTCFLGKDSGGGNAGGNGGGYAGFSPRDLVLGMSGDMRWEDTLGGRRQFYTPPGKMEPKDIADRYKKLFEPLGGSSLGELVHESLRWGLADPVDEAACKRAEHALSKLAGITSIKIDAKSRLLQATFELAGLRSAGAPLPSAAGAAAKDEALFVRFDTLAIFDVLDKEKILLAPSPDAKDAKKEDPSKPEKKD